MGKRAEESSLPTSRGQWDGDSLHSYTSDEYKRLKQLLLKVAALGQLRDYGTVNKDYTDDEYYPRSPADESGSYSAQDAEDMPPPGYQQFFDQTHRLGGISKKWVRGI